MGALTSVVLAVAITTLATFVAAPTATTRQESAATPVGQVERGLLVTVLDKDNVAITDLTAKDFLVFEDGVRREITGAEVTTAPISVSILIDTTKSPMGVVEPTRDIRAALLTFVQTVQAATEQAEVSITETAGAAVLLRDFTSNPEDLDKSINRIVPNQRINSVMLEAMIDAARAIGKRPGPRRVILTIDRGSGESSQVQPQPVADEVALSGASVWAISVDSHSGTVSPNRDIVLDVLTEHTGGIRLTAQVPSALEMMTKMIADALCAQYLVTYNRPDGPPSRLVVPSTMRDAKVLRATWRQ